MIEVIIRDTELEERRLESGAWDPDNNNMFMGDLAGARRFVFTPEGESTADPRYAKCLDDERDAAQKLVEEYLKD